MNKKILIGLVSATLLATGVSAAGFAKTATYPDGKFTDVPASEWYAAEVKNTFELGLMNGTSDSTFEPNGNVTVAEAITMASRAASLYAGETIAAADGEWYQMYVNYAISKGFVKEGQFDSYDRAAKRYEVAQIFENAMPDGYFAAKNDVKEIPDVDASLPYSADLLTLYKAGVVMGSDSYGNFRPEDNIIRAEAAAIINRVALPENRLAKALDKYSSDDAYTLAYHDTYNGTQEYISSGWRLDNRGGVPRTNLAAAYGSFVDTSETEGVAMIREFNKVTTGKFNLDTIVNVTGSFDGFSLGFYNEAGNPVYQAYTKDGGWTLLQADGTYKTILPDAKATKKFVFNVEVDLDNGRCTTFINDTDCGTYPLAVSGDDLNMVNFRYATDEKSMATAGFGRFNITANYAVYDMFEWTTAGTMPLGWTGGNAVVESAMLKVSENGGAMKSFSPVSGTVITNFEFILDKSQNTAFDVRSGAKSVVKFTTDADNFYANGVKVYENYYENLWYRIRVEAKTQENKAVIWVNGRKVGEVDFAEKTTSIDNICINNFSADVVSFDDINVYEKVYHEDYVPTPVKPAGEEKYTVGMNICSLWRNGTHWGWSTITAYDDIHPVLGYYDEGSPESADWEIKMMVEHGIDFQAFCWYPENTNAPIKDPGYNYQLYDGFMYAEYSDMMDYCLIWECANAGKPANMDAWKNYYVPYFIENFFKDERYLKLDNKPVLAVFGSSALASSLGGSSALNEAFAYLEEEVKKLGFDGMVYLSSHSNSGIAAMGFDGFVAYNWGNAGSSLDVNKSQNLAKAKDTSYYTVPTISVGFNNVAWARTRFPLMSAEDYKKAHTWVRDEYIPEYAEEGTWNENLVWLSTWNEYGEGTYLMPTTDEKGFGWLDALREVYSDEKADASINLIPTEEQLYRINRMFPQYRRLLRKQGFVNETVSDSDLEVVFTADYSDKANISVGNTKTFEFRDDGLYGTVEGDTLTHYNNLAIKAAEISHIRVNIDVPKGKGCEIFFITDKDKSWSSSKGTNFTATEDGLASYIVDMKKIGTWKDTITTIRLDPGQCAPGTTGNDFHIKSIEFMSAAKAPSKKIYINDKEATMNFGYKAANNGDVLVAFDPSNDVALDMRLGAFHTWDAADKSLTLEVNGHKVVYTVGSSDYNLDGKKVSLGYELGEIDGLPLIPIEKLCKDVGFEYSVNEKDEVVIYTHQKAYYEEIASRVPGTWEFHAPGDAEGWTSPHMSLVVAEGALVADSNSSHRDPIITLTGSADLIAEKYKAFEIRCKYSHDSNGNGFTMYFTTDSHGSMDEVHTVKHSIEKEATEWVTYTVDLTENTAWKGIIKNLRFDPFNAVGTMEIDYMKFVEDENYVYVDPAKAPFELKNPNADEGVQPFFSDNSTISVVEHEGNKVFLVTTKPGKQWSYFRQDVRYKPGATYKVEYDVKLVGAGDITDGSDESIATDIMVNARYSVVSGSTDHVLGDVRRISVSDGWQHRTVEFTVPADSPDRGSDQFAIYANPIGENGANYYVDNIVITEYLPEEE